MPAMMQLDNVFQDAPTISLGQAAHNVTLTVRLASMQDPTSALLAIPASHLLILFRLHFTYATHAETDIEIQETAKPVMMETAFLLMAVLQHVQLKPISHATMGILKILMSAQFHSQLPTDCGGTIPTQIHLIMVFR